MAWKGPAARALILLLLVPAAGCKGEGPGKSEKAGKKHAGKSRGAGAVKPERKTCFEKAWEPMKVSSGSHTAVGVSAATGIGQVGVLWIEAEEDKSGVYFTRISGSSKEETVGLTRGGSAYPPSAAAWTGSEFALAWGDDRFRRIEIFIARVSPSGKVTMKARRFTNTEPTQYTDAYASDSSQEPDMAYYKGNLLLVWGGPGDYGRQQVYHTTISRGGTPIYDPYEITEGPFGHTGMHLTSSDEGAALCYCVRKGDVNEIFRALLGETPPRVLSGPSKVAGTGYSPCLAVEVFTGEGGAIIWPVALEEGGATRYGLRIMDVDADGAHGEAADVGGVELVKFPGKYRRAFDAAPAGGRAAVAWVDAPPGGERGIKAGVFSAEGELLCEPLAADTGVGPTDARILYSGHGKQYVLLWVDRDMGKKTFSLKAQGIVQAFE